MTKHPTTKHPTIKHLTMCLAAMLVILVAVPSSAQVTGGQTTAPEVLPGSRVTVPVVPVPALPVVPEARETPGDERPEVQTEDDEREVDVPDEEDAEPEDEDAEEESAQAEEQARRAALSTIELMIYDALPVEVDPLTQFGYRFFRPTVERTPESVRTLDDPLVRVRPTRSLGPDYRLGPGDVLQLFIWGTPVDTGDLSSLYQLSVQPGGTIFFAPTGPLSVIGRTIGEIQNVIQAQLERRYRQIGVSLAVESLREFPVYVAGFVESPGTVNTTAMDTLFQVLSRAGGIEKTGSLRTITITRRSGERVVVDLYDLILEGRDVDVPLEEGDSIFVPPIGPVAAVYGQVRRPGIYELSGTQTVQQLLEMAGGALPSAFVADASISQYSEEERIRIDGNLNRITFNRRRLDNADILRVGRVREEERNRVTASGEFKFPGNYSLERFDTLERLLREAQFLTETNQDYGRIYRVLPGGDRDDIAFSPRRVLDREVQIPLRAGDEIRLYRRGWIPADLEWDRFPETVVLRGTVRRPQVFAWHQGMTLADLFGREAFLENTNRHYAEITRRRDDGTRAEDLTFSPARILAGEDERALRPGDVVRFTDLTTAPELINYDRFPETVVLRGTVRERERWAWYEGLTLQRLLSEDLFTANTNRDYAEILRTDEEGVQDVVTFSPREVLSGDQDVALNRRDIVSFTERYVHEPIRVGGDAVELGAVIPYFQGITLINLVSLVELGHDIKDVRAEIINRDGTRQTIYLEDEFGEDAVNFVRLQPGAEVKLERLQAQERRRNVVVRGEVHKAGSISFDRDQPLRLSDALERAGGYTARAFPRAIVLLRESVAASVEAQIDRHIAVLESSIAQLEAVSTGSDPQTINIQLQAAAQRAQLANLRASYGSVLGRISLEIPDTLERLRGSPADVVLEAGDQIVVPSEPDFVSVLGEVTNSITINYTEGMRVRDLLDQAGWAMQAADVPAAYIVKASGRIISATNRTSFLFFKRTILNDRLEPGDLVYIPREPQRVPVALPIIRDVTQIIGNLLSTTMSAATLLVTVGAL